MFRQFEIELGRYYRFNYLGEKEDDTKLVREFRKHHGEHVRVVRRVDASDKRFNPGMYIVDNEHDAQFAVFPGELLSLVTPVKGEAGYRQIYELNGKPRDGKPKTKGSKDALRRMRKEAAARERAVKLAEKRNKQWAKEDAKRQKREEAEAARRQCGAEGCPCTPCACSPPCCINLTLGGGTAGGSGDVG